MISACNGGCFADYINLVRTIFWDHLLSVPPLTHYKILPCSTGTGKVFGFINEGVGSIYLLQRRFWIFPKLCRASAQSIPGESLSKFNPHLQTDSFYRQ
jgi:hypothetical protein